MKRLLGSIFVLGLFVVAVAAQKPDSSVSKEKPADPPPGVKLPPAKEVVEKYVKAIGGRDALLKVKSRYQSGTIELSPMGVKGTVETYTRSDNRSLTKIVLAGIGDILDGYDGTTAWTSNPMQGSRVKAGKELQQTIRMSDFGREANMEKSFGSMTVKGIEKVGERDAYVVVGSNEGFPDEIIYFDTETGLILRTDNIIIAPEGQQATTSYYEDYREVNGIKSAFKIRAKTPAFEITTIVSETKYDVVIEDSKFSRPN